MSKQHLNKVANPSDAGLENLSPEADAYLAEALEDFNARQRAMKQEWHFDTYERWGFEQLTGNFRLEFADGATRPRAIRGSGAGIIRMSIPPSRATARR
jgi:hypothetical protein